MMLHRLLALLFVLIAAPLSAAPALWKLSDGDTIIYLFGTIHMLPGGETWQSGPVKAAFDTADTLVLEVLLPTDPREIATTMYRRGIGTNLPPVLDRLPPERKGALAAALRDSGIPDTWLPNMETWLISLTLASAQLARQDIAAAQGVETQLRAVAGIKKLIGLETLDQQFALFDTLSEADQRALLDATVGEMPTLRTQVNDILAAWRSGDTDRLANLLNADLRATPGIAKALLTDRNARWADWIQTRMAAPGTVFLAVGAGHLAGPSSVQAMLAKRGLKAARVR